MTYKASEVAELITEFDGLKKFKVQTYNQMTTPSCE